MNTFLKEIKNYRYVNHLYIFLNVLFILFIYIKLPIEYSFFKAIYWYITCLFLGNYAASNSKRFKKWKYKNSKRELFIVHPLVGGIMILTYGIPIYLINHFFKIM
tara:strand:+ start:886 stop:1200 length:315 start_codon:yes stop_codon:yes gene_type:complete